MKRNIILISLFFLAVLSVRSDNNPDKKSFRINKNLTIFNSVFRQLDMFYVDTLNYDKMTQTAIDKMLEKFDPYTVYIPESETDELKFLTTGEYAGIGSLISQNNKNIVISDPYEGMPAQKNGLKAGDILLEIDGTSIKGMTTTEVSNRLKGAPNTTIKLKIQRYKQTKPFETSFKREKIKINPVSYFGKVDEKVGYIQLHEFTDEAASEVKNDINQMIKNDHIESLIFDLRDNGGGLVDEAVKILSFFLPKGTTVVTTKGKSDEGNHTYKTPMDPIFPNMKLVLLTNRSSASASEITAGCIQDLDRGIIVGERTYGKGLVQNIRPINYGGHLKITTAKYYIPSGRCIQAIDYAHRNEDGSVGRVPDSLTSVFKTKLGRKVKDGGGITPDTLTNDEQKLNISYYIFLQNLYFDFATTYFYEHPTIASPETFSLSDDDYKAFCEYLNQKKFTYKSQTERYFDDLLNISKYEGLDKTAKAEFDALKAKLTPEIQKSLEENKNEVKYLLSLEILKRYYYQKGMITFSLRTDKDLKVAIELLKNTEKYNQFLTVKS